MWDRTKLYWTVLMAAFGAVLWYCWQRGNKYMRQVAITGAEAKLSKHLEDKDEAKKIADRLERDLNNHVDKFQESRDRLRAAVERVRNSRK